MDTENQILDDDLIERFNWVEGRVMECGYTLLQGDKDTLEVDYTDDPELDYIMVLEALNDRRRKDFSGNGFKKIVFPL